jgi:hypothetical protein
MNDYVASAIAGWKLQLAAIDRQYPEHTIPYQIEEQRKRLINKIINAGGAFQ